jgi:hypothetical protein
MGYRVELDERKSAETRSGPLKVREIEASDHERLAEFLGRGLGYHSSFYRSVLEKLRQHDTPPGFPKYGYALESASKIVGSILLIFSRIEQDGIALIRCHVTSWYVEPAYRPFATLFFAKQLKRENVTYMNVSARPPTIPIIMQQGFRKYSNGQFLVPTLVNLATASRVTDVLTLDGEAQPNLECSEFERKVLADHAKYGCISVWCVQAGRAYPFVFHERSFRGLIAGVQLVYCRNVEMFARFARPLSLYLLARRKLLVRIDANGPIDGLVGKYIEGMEPRYFKGVQPRQGDLAYTQTAMCPLARSPTGISLLLRSAMRSG